MVVRNRGLLRRMSIGQRCIDDVLHTSTHSGLNGSPVLFDPYIRRVKRVGTNEEQALDTLKCGLQGLGPIKIGFPLFHGQRGKFLMLPRSARRRDYSLRSESPKLRNDGLSQVSTGTRYEKLFVCKTHVVPPNTNYVGITGRSSTDMKVISYSR